MTAMRQRRRVKALKQQRVFRFDAAAAGGGHLLVFATTRKGSAVQVPEWIAQATYKSGGTMVFVDRD